MIYVRSSFDSYVIDCAKNVESIWIRISHPILQQEIFINGTYHPPSSPLQFALVDYLQRSIDIYQRNRTAVICISGDFNRLDMSDVIIDTGITEVPSPPTRMNARLDLAFTNRPDLIQKATVVSPSLTTDHQALIINPVKRLPPIRTYAQFFDTSFRYKAKFNSQMNSVDFMEIVSANRDLDNAAQALDAAILSCFKCSFPLRTVLMSDRDPVWMTQRIKYLLTLKHRANRSKNLAKVVALDERIQTMKINSMERRGSNVGGSTLMVLRIENLKTILWSKTPSTRSS